MSKKPGIVIFATQAGARPQKFDAERCEQEVAAPIRALLAEEGPVDMVLVAIVCDPELAVSEEAEEYTERDDGMSTAPHYHTPTSRFLIERLRKERSDRRFEYLNIRFREIHGSPLNYAVNSAWAHGGIDGIIVCQQGVPVPTVEEVRVVLKHLEQNQVLVIPPVPMLA